MFQILRLIIISFVFITISLRSQSQNLTFVDTAGLTFVNYQQNWQLDHSNNILILCPLQHQADLQFGSGTYLIDTVNNSNFDNLLVRYNSDTVVWSYNMPFRTNSFAITNSNDIILIGSKELGSIDLDNDPSNSVILSNPNVGFILKLDSNGHYKQHTLFDYNFLGSGGFNHVVKMLIDHNDNLLIGYWFATPFNCSQIGSTPNTLNPTSASECAILKYETNNFNLIWAKQYGNTNTTLIQKMETDPNNNVIVQGIFNGTLDFDPSSTSQHLETSVNLSPTTSGKPYVLKLDENGNFKFVKLIYNPGLDIGINLFKTDKHGNMLIGGRLNDNLCDFDPGTGTQNIIALGSPGFFVKWDSSGNFNFLQKFLPIYDLGGSYIDNRIINFAFDSNNNYYITGHNAGALGNSNSLDFNCNDTLLDFFKQDGLYLIKEDEDGNHIWGRGMPHVYGISSQLLVDKTNNIYIAGVVDNNNLPVADYDPSLTGTAIIGGTVYNTVNYIAKYSNECPFVAPPTFNGYTICRTDSLLLTLPIPAQGVYQWSYHNPGSSLLDYTLSGTIAPSNFDLYLAVRDMLPNGCYSSTIIDTVHKITGDIPIISDTIVCPGSQVVLKPLNLNPTSNYFWFDASNTLLSNNDSLIVPNISSFSSFFVVDSNVNICNPMLIPVNVYTFAPPTTFPDQTIFKCLNYTGTINNFTTYTQWYNDTLQAPFQTGAAIFISNFLSDTLFYIRDSTGNNCISPFATLQIKVDSVTNYTINPMNATICEGDTIGIEISSPMGYLFSVSYPPIYAIGTTQYFNPTTTLIDTVLIINSAGCTAMTSFTIQVLPAPVAPINFQNNQLYISANTFTNVQWYYNGSLIANNVDTITPIGNGIYNVVVTDASNCTGESIYTLNNLAANDIQENEVIVTDQGDMISIHSSNKPFKSAQLYNSVGQQVYVDKEHNHHTLFLNKINYAKGLYYLSVTTDKTIIIKLLF